VPIVSERGEGRFVTTHHGFRNGERVRRRKPPGVRRVLRGDMHWNARGHSLAARTLLPWVTARLERRLEGS
jgi:hypothetical protein